jgi:hypothetical protein
MAYLTNAYRQHRGLKDDSRDNGRTFSFEITTVVVFLVLANWFVYASRDIDFDDNYFEYQAYQSERNAELRYLVRTPVKLLVSH